MRGRAAGIGMLALLGGGAMAQGPASAVDQERLLATIRALPTARAALGTAEARRGLRDTETMLVERVKELGLQPVVQEFTWTYPLRAIASPDPAATRPADEPAGAGGDAAAKDARDAQFRNIIVDLPGGEYAERVILVSAHLDAVPRSPGADDDGTGVAAVLELARVLKDQPRKRTIRFALFNLEEAGLVGSQHYVTEFVKASKQAGEGVHERIVGMMSLEMLGYFTDEPNSQRSPIPKVEGVFDPPTVGDSIAVVGIAKHKEFSERVIKGMAASAPKLKITAADFLPVPVPDMMRSDHRPFITAGIAAVMITDTADFRNSNYHTPKDTIETLDPERFTLVVRALAGALDRMANE